MAESVRTVDEYGRVVFGDCEVPDPYSPESEFAQWHGRTCNPSIVISGLRDEPRHRLCCDNGWTRSGKWSFVCGRCHPAAVDNPGSSKHQTRAASLGEIPNGQ